MVRTLGYAGYVGPGPELEGLDELRQLCLGTEAAYLAEREALRRCVARAGHEVGVTDCNVCRCSPPHRTQSNSTPKGIQCGDDVVSSGALRGG